jgi:hypothetical protein
MGLPMGVLITNLLEERAAFQRQLATWQSIVEHLAEGFACPISEVEQMLRTAVHQLEQGAHIKDFISVLAIKQVKDLLKPYRHTPPRHEPRDLHHPQPSHPQPYL